MRIRRRILRSQIFFHRQFSGEPTQIMRRNFVEYLGTDCFHSCRIPVELSAASTSNTKRTKPSSNVQCTDNIVAGVVVVYRSLGSLEGPQHQFNMNNIYL
jgi:hypothetical protein